MVLPAAAFRHALRSVLVTIVSLAVVELLPGVARALPPANDYFSNPTTINPAALPYTSTVDITEATTEGAEPFQCNYSTQTVWYRLVPTRDMWLSATGSGVFSNLSVFVDPLGSLYSLSFVACTSYNGQTTFLAHAGIRYALQAMAPCCGSFGSLTVNVQEVPPPTPNVSFSYYPSSPSSFDQVQFYDQSSDPGQQQITGHRFDYGDGSNSVDTTCCPVHRFSADGDYVVTLTVTTADGRSGTGSTTVHVRTHDVAVSNFKVPQSASSGQTKLITVSIKNTRYPETVQVELAKSVPGSFSGFQTIGTLTQFVMPKGGNKSTDFSFSYTFTPDDAAIGKVTLRANAQLISANDALPGDNIAISDLIRVGNASSGRASTAGFEMYATTGDIEFGPRAVTPNPVRAGAELTIRLGMPEAGEVTVEAVDLAGRIVASSPQGSLEAGIHDVRLAWRERPAPGVYWIRATQAGRTSPAVRVAVLE